LVCSFLVGFGWLRGRKNAPAPDRRDGKTPPCVLLYSLPMVDGVAIKRHSILAGIGGIASIAALWRCRKSHTLYIVLPKVHLGKRQKRISRKPVRAKRVFHPRTLGGVKVKGDGKVLRALQVAFGWDVCDECDAWDI